MLSEGGSVAHRETGRRVEVMERESPPRTLRMKVRFPPHSDAELKPFARRELRQASK